VSKVRKKTNLFKNVGDFHGKTNQQAFFAVKNLQGRAVAFSRVYAEVLEKKII
jgi:hypothetical protein